jgi:quercetin dioxygenase-like cupin family protein
MTRLLWLALFLVVTASAWARDTHSIMTETLVKSSNSWDGSPLPPYSQGTPEVTVLKITIPPGVALPMHKHPYMNAGVLLSGELTVHTQSGETKNLKAGEALIELVNAWHYGANEGTEPAVIMVVYAGIEGMPITVLEEGAAHE